MTFMDKKEQVIDLQLTQYGKHLLSKGKMRPVYYAFFDNNIIYDGQYAGIVEEPREVQDRIKITPQSETQYTFVSLEKQVKELNQLIRSNKVKITDEDVQNYQVKEYALSLPIGTSALNSSKLPAWNINFLKGEFNSTVSNITQAQQVVKIPQIDVETVMFKTQVFSEVTSQGINDGQDFQDPGGTRAGSQLYAGTNNDYNLNSVQFPDGSYVDVFDDFLLMSVDEENTQFDNDNLEIEVFLVQDVDEKGNVITEEQKLTTPTREQLTPLSFIKKRNMIENGILLDPEDDTIDLDDLDPSYVEYWFDVFADSEIDRAVLCANLPAKNVSGGVFTQDVYNCPDNFLQSSTRQTERSAGGQKIKDKGDSC